MALTTPYTDKQPDNHESWLEAEGIRTYMAGQRTTLNINLIAIPPLFATLYGQVNHIGLGLWTAAIFALLGYRFWLTHLFEKHASNWQTQECLDFHNKHAWTLPSAAALWGALAWLFYAKTPTLIQFIVWVSLVCVGVFGATSYVSHLKTLKRFINTLVVVCLVAMFWTSYISSDPLVRNMTLKLTPLVLVFWMILITKGKLLNEAFCQRVVLLKGNMELIDSLKAQTERAVKAIDMKNRLLASAAHDIRQPVLALDLYANLLRSDPRMAPTLTPKITVATRSVVEMFDSLFDLSRLETGQIQIHKSNIDVASFMDELFLQYQPAAQLKGLELRLRTCQTHIYSDPQLLKRAIGNLIANAIKFTEKNGVLLACRKTSQGVRFEVWDTGMGIATDQQQAVFREFYKAPLIANAPIGMNEGFGLGLSIVARFCDALGHKFSMRSTLDKGSVFKITVAANPADVHKR